MSARCTASVASAMTPSATTSAVSGRQLYFVKRIHIYSYDSTLHNMPKISIIIPVYNTGRWLRRCLDSVLTQTWQDYEVVLVDDGSTDDSSIVLDEYAERDDRFRVFHEQNRGSSLARKFGMSKAQGEWLVFIDSDDDVHPTYIESLYNAVTKHNLLIATCDMQTVSNDSEPRDIIKHQTVILNEDSLHKRFFKYCFWGFPGKIYHKTVFDGIFFPEYNINEDYVVMAQLFNRNPAIAYIPDALYHYRTNPESQSHVRLSPRIMDEYRNKKWVLGFYDNNAPKFSALAKVQLTESAIKLFRVIKHGDTAHDYIPQLHELKQFFDENLMFILFTPHLLLGLKLEAVKIKLSRT